MDENNNINAIPEQDTPVQPVESAQPVYSDNAPQAPVAQPAQAPAQPVYAQQPVYLDNAAQAPVAQPAQAPAQPVYIDNAAQPVYAQQPIYSDNAAQPAYTQQPAYAAAPVASSPKKRLVALILAIAVGSLGVNQLYLGLGSKRLVMAIIATVCDALCWIPILGVISAIASIPLWIICYIGMIKDIIATAKGQMVDGQGLVVRNW